MNTGSSSPEAPNDLRLTLHSGWRMVLRKEKSKSQIPEKDDRAAYAFHGDNGVARFDTHTSGSFKWQGGLTT
jgi:hypothetical protein